MAAKYPTEKRCAMVAAKIHTVIASNNGGKSSVGEAIRNQRSDHTIRQTQALKDMKHVQAQPKKFHHQLDDTATTTTHST